MSKIRFENLVDKDGNTIEIEDKYIQNIEALSKISKMAKNSGKKLRKVFEGLNEEAIDKAIASGKA